MSVVKSPSTESSVPQPETRPGEVARSRRALLTGAAAALGALAVQAVALPEPASAAGVVLGGTNNSGHATTIQNTAHSSSAKAIVGRTTYTGAASSSAGIAGESKGTGGIGVYGVAKNGTGARGVLGRAPHGTGVRGESTDNYGVYGTGGNSGVYGTGAYGVYGVGTTAGCLGTSGAGYGVYGTAPVGVLGIGSGNTYGVWGYNSSTSGYGVNGQGGYRGVYGSGGNAGVYGTSAYVGLWGDATSTSGVNYGVYANTASAASGWAGVFNGRVYVSGFLTKAGGGFQVDHPLEPERRYLVHSFVEAPEMLNIYSGTVTLDARGRATVRLPRYFETANARYRYQLTPIGGAAPGLHISRKVAGNRFAIAGGTPGLEVCWQVSGVRQDAWAKANPMKVEPLKAKRDQGKYLQPKLFGKRTAAGIHHLAPGNVRRLQRHPARFALLDAATGG